MTAMPVYTPPRATTPGDELHRRAMSHALYQGALIPSMLWTSGGFFVMIPHGLLRALICARDLTATQYRYLLSLLEFSSNQDTAHPYAAIRSAKHTRTPSIHDWCAWLGDVQPQQVYTARRQLAAHKVISFVDDDPNKVALNPQWETWHPAVFQPRAARTGAGRPRTTPAPDTAASQHKARRVQTRASASHRVAPPPPAATLPTVEDTPSATVEAAPHQPTGPSADHVRPLPPAMRDRAEMVLADTHESATPTAADTEPVLADAASEDVSPGADAVFFASEADINGFADHKSIDLPPEIYRFALDADKAAPANAATPLPKKERDLNKDLTKGETPATAGVPHRRTARLVTPLAPAFVSEDVTEDGSPRPTDTPSSKSNTHRSANPPPNSARPPRLPLPERQPGETTRTYWLRALLAADPDQRHAQRAVVHDAARAVLGLTLDKKDLRLIGQLRRAAGSWGTVLHWVLKTGDVAAVDVRAYLYGFLRQQDREEPRGTAASWLPVTPSDVTHAGDDQEEEVAADSPDKALTASPPVAEDDHQTRRRKLGNALRVHGVWQTMGLQGLPAGGYDATLDTLERLRAQGDWTLAEFVPLVAMLASPAQMPAARPAQRWTMLLSHLEQRAQARARQQQGPTSADEPAVVVPIPLPTPTVEVLSVTPEAPDPAQVRRRAHALRRLCGAGTEFGQTLLAYIELDERDALEEIATALLTTNLPEERTEAVLRRAWREIVRMGGSVSKHTRSQRQHHWRTALRCGMREIQREEMHWRIGDRT